MASTTDDLFRAALHLSATERADLAALLLESLESEADEGVEETWRQEVERRAAELESGAIKPLAWEEVRTEIRRIVGD